MLEVKETGCPDLYLGSVPEESPNITLLAPVGAYQG